jgi:DNA helicase-2/ATP-dependent DNA helicase PcrA
MSQFNPEQQRAVEAGFGPLAVVAGPGSGKTKVIVGRAGRLIESEGVPGYNVLLVTFTNQAAREMKSRLLKEIGSKAEGVSCGTMHGQILRHVLKGFPDCPPMQRRGLSGQWGILNPDDRSALLKRIHPQLSEAAQAFMSDSSVSVEALGGVISLSKNWGYSKEKLRRGLKDSHPKFKLYSCALELWDHYDRELASNQMIDFDDILIIGAEAVTECDWIRKSLANRFQHIFVDEFQDTNAIQFRFLKAVALEHGNLYVVGDPKQSIYLFRGSMPSIFDQFFGAFPAGAVVNLNRNYRSAPHIVELANKLIGTMPDRIAEDRDLLAERGDLITDATNAFAPFYTQYSSDYEEANAVLERVLEMKSAGYGLGDMAVLYRKNASKRALEQVFMANNVPVVVANDKALFERKDVRDLLAFLRAAWQPWDKLAYRRLVKNFSVGVTEKTFEAVLASAGGDVFKAIDELAARPGDHGERFRSLVDQLALLRKHAYKESGEEVRAVLDHLVEHYITAEYRDNDDRLQQSEERLGVIADEAARLISGKMDSRDILERFSLMETAHSSKSDDAVQLMTIHGSKGLEFPVTFCVGVDDEAMPGGNVDREEDLNEERRILFVAVTRAKDHLFLSSAYRRRQGSQVINCDPCRFLFDVDLVRAESRTATALTDNPAFSKLPPIKIQNPDAAPKKRPGRGEIDPDALEALHRDPGAQKLIKRFNATVLMCMPKSPANKEGAQRG